MPHDQYIGQKALNSILFFVKHDQKQNLVGLCIVFITSSWSTIHVGSWHLLQFRPGNMSVNSTVSCYSDAVKQVYGYIIN